jgi:hypothetical protein
MKKISIVIALTTLLACNNNNTPAPEKIFEASLNETSVYSLSQVASKDDNYENDNMLVDTAVVNMIFNDLIHRDDVQFYEEIDKPCTKEKIQSIIKSERKVMMEDPDKPGAFVEVIDNITIQASDVIEIVTKESWAFDTKNVSMKKQIDMIAPVINVYDDDGALKGKLILFWIKLKN